MSAEDPLFILYTSGSTGKPKGVLHTTGGYLVYTSMTHRIRLRLSRRRNLLVHRRCRLGHRAQLYRLRPARQRRDDADVRGRAELSRTRRASGRSSTSTRSTIFYTAPTAIRALMREGEDYVRKTSRRSLRLLGTVGEPINPEAWLWYYDHVGDAALPDRRYLVADRDRRHPDHPAARRDAIKPGSATRPFFGVEPVIVDGDGKPAGGRRRGQSVHRATPGRGRCAPCSAITSASCRPISRPSRGSISPATARGATRTGSTGSPAGSMT